MFTKGERECLVTAREVLERAQMLFARKDWKHMLTQDGTELYQMNLDDICPIPANLVIATYNQSKHNMINKVWGVASEEMAKANDPKLTSWKLIENGPSLKIISQCNSMMWPIWPRQTVFAQACIEEKDASYLVGFSVEHAKAPNLEDSHVRTRVHMSVYEYVDNRNGTTTVRRITLVDPKGIIPVKLITRYSKNLVNVFNSWRDNCIFNLK